MLLFKYYSVIWSFRGNRFSFGLETNVLNIWFKIETKTKSNFVWFQNERKIVKTFVFNLEENGKEMSDKMAPLGEARLEKRLEPLRIIWVQLRAPFKPLDAILLWCSRGLMGPSGLHDAEMR